MKAEVEHKLQLPLDEIKLFDYLIYVKTINDFDLSLPIDDYIRDKYWDHHNYDLLNHRVYLRTRYQCNTKDFIVTLRSFPIIDSNIVHLSETDSPFTVTVAKKLLNYLNIDIPVNEDTMSNIFDFENTMNKYMVNIIEIWNYRSKRTVIMNGDVVGFVNFDNYIAIRGRQTMHDLEIEIDIWDENKYELFLNQIMNISNNRFVHSDKTKLQKALNKLA